VVRRDVKEQGETSWNQPSFADALDPKPGIRIAISHGKGCKVAFRNIRLKMLKQDDSASQ
jgi:hypothetical protein